MNKVWKRGLSLVLCLALLMTAGCAGGRPLSEEELKAEEEEMALVEKDAMAAEEGYKEKEESAPADKKAAASYPRLILSTVYDSLYHEERGLVSSLEYDQIALSGESAEAYPQLAAALAEMSSRSAEQMKEEYESSKETALESEEPGGEGSAMRFESKYSVGRADDRAVSIRSRYVSFTGGAHGFSFTGAENFDARTGKRLTLSDISPDPAALLDRACDSLKKWCEERNVNLFDPDGLRASVEEMYEEDSLNWALDPDGISLLFAPYSIAPYAAGELTARVLFSESPDLFEGDICRQADTWGMSLFERQSAFADLDGDGSPEEISVDTSRDEYDTVTGICINIGDEAYTFDQYGYGLRAFLLHGGEGKTMLYADISGDNDYHSLEIFDLTGGEAVRRDTLQAGCSVLYDDETNQAGTCLITDPSSFILAVRAGDISTYSMSRFCHLGEDGLPVPETDYYTVVNGGYQFTVLTPFRASTVDPETEKILEKGVTVKKGEVLTLVRSNNGSWVELTAKDGTLYRVEIDSSDWPRTIDGKDISDIFDGLIFAG
ncbi:MAG: DUF3298 domain-containing protein [Lachnospiraceae bacterium]|nr:DUF3298 domain-containing protein [Lachnospiraceae bacterium]MBQ4302980.1 DUF3298 domain-containing protein [Lachnospiraceae bacterium]